MNHALAKLSSRSGNDRYAVHRRAVLLALLAFSLGFLAGYALVENALVSGPGQAADLGWVVRSGWVMFAAAAALWALIVLQYAHVLHGVVDASRAQHVKRLCRPSRRAAQTPAERPALPAKPTLRTRFQRAARPRIVAANRCVLDHPFAAGSEYSPVRAAVVDVDVEAAPDADTVVVLAC